MGRVPHNHQMQTEQINDSLHFSESLKIWNITTEKNNWDTALTTMWKSRNEHQTATYSVQDHWMVKMSMLPKAMCKFNTIPNKIPMAFFLKLEKVILKLHGTSRDPEQPKQFWKRKKMEGLTFSDFKTYLQSYSNQNSTVLL